MYTDSFNKEIPIEKINFLKEYVLLCRKFNMVLGMFNDGLELFDEIDEEFLCNDIKDALNIYSNGNPVLLEIGIKE